MKACLSLLIAGSIAVQAQTAQEPWKPLGTGLDTAPKPAHSSRTGRVTVTTRSAPAGRTGGTALDAPLTPQQERAKQEEARARMLAGREAERAAAAQAEKQERAKQEETRARMLAGREAERAAAAQAEKAEHARFMAERDRHAAEREAREQEARTLARENEARQAEETARRDAEKMRANSAVERLAAQRANRAPDGGGDGLRKINETLDRLFDLRARCLARQPVMEEAMARDRERQDRAAGRAMLSASREEQLRAAMLAKFVQENGPISAQSLQFMDEGTRNAARLVPGAMPRELDEFAAAIDANRRKLEETNSAILEMERRRIELEIAGLK